MNVESLNPAVLKKVIALLEKREQLQKLIEEMNEEITALITAEELESKASPLKSAAGKSAKSITGKSRPARPARSATKASGKKSHDPK